MKKPSKDLIGTCIGTLLGDSWLEKYSLSFEHADEDKEYALWKCEILDNLSGRICKIYDRHARVAYIKNRKVTSQPSVDCRLLYLDLVNEVKQLMYNADNVKLVTKTALNLVTPFGFAMWYFDDGSFNYSQISSSIYTNGFTLNDQVILKNWLKSNYGINANIAKKDDKHYLYFKRSETLKVFAYIESNCPNIPHCMRRKIPVEWKHTEYQSSYKWNRLSYKLSDYDAKQKVKDNLLKYHKETDKTNLDKQYYFNILGYRNWIDSYSISKAIRRIFGSMEAALIYANLPIHIC